MSSTMLEFGTTFRYDRKKDAVGFCKTNSRGKLKYKPKKVRLYSWEKDTWWEGWTVVGYVMKGDN